MNTKLFGWAMTAAALSALSLASVACSGADATPESGGNPTAGDENDIKSGTCGPATTLTCKAGYTITTEGCASSRVAGAPVQGRCVNVDAAKLTGSWLEELSSPALGVFWQYSLASDGTYAARGGCRQDGPGVHCFAITQSSGTWTLSKSGPQLGAPGGASELVLVDTFNQKDTFFYSVDGKKLSLSKTYGVGASESVFDKQ